MNYGIVGANTHTSGRKQSNCIDAGSENCPCYLAVTGDCLICSRLQGKDFCNCNWRGVCVYNEFKQGKGRVNNPRVDFEAKIVQRKFYKEDLVVYVVNVGKGFAMKASRPGSYLFIKASGASNFYDVPISVMRADIENGLLHLAIKIISAKTKLLLGEENNLIVRGPYRNGIHGISNIMEKRKKEQKTLIIAKGVGVAPGILTSEALHNKGTVELVIDTQKIEKGLIADYIEGDGPRPEDSGEHSAGEDNIATSGNGDICVSYLSLADSGVSEDLVKLMKERQYDNVIILASDYYIETLGKLAHKTLPTANIAVSNNFRICCGEGLCGSCSVDTVDGETVKMCKCQYKGEEFLNNICYSKSSL